MKVEGWEAKLREKRNRNRIKDKRVFIDNGLTRKERDVNKMLNDRARRKGVKGDRKRSTEGSILERSRSKRMR